MSVDKELLFKRRIEEADVNVEGLGTFRVRGLTRSEALSVRSLADLAAIERGMLVLGLVDPELTEDEVKRWQANSPAGEMEDLTNKIAELSGMNEGAAKEAYLAFEENADAEFRVLPGDEAGDDGGGAEG